MERLTTNIQPNKNKEPDAWYRWFYEGMKRFLNTTVIEIGGTTKYVYIPDAKDHNIKKGKTVEESIWIDKPRLLHFLNNTTKYDNKPLLLITFKRDDTT